MTLATADWICDFFNLSDLEKEELYARINNVKPNTNGYDIEVDSSHKIVAEVKCIIPINKGNYYGAAQRNSILDDAVKLKIGKKSISNTDSFFKILSIIDIGVKTEQAIKTLLTPAKSIRTSDPSRIKRHKIVPFFRVIDPPMSVYDLNKDMIFIKKIKV